MQVKLDGPQISCANFSGLNIGLVFAFAFDFAESSVKVLSRKVFLLRLKCRAMIQHLFHSLVAVFFKWGALRR